MCSASKVRCDRQKPLCGRCDKLGYPCFYSPARRVGRPQGRNKRQPRNRRDSLNGGAERESASPPERPVRPVSPGSPINHRDSGHLVPFLSPPESEMPPGLIIPPVLLEQPGPGPESASATTSSSASRQDGCESDCMGLAMATQRQLEPACRKLSSTPAAGPWTKASVQNAEAAIQAAATAMRRMSMTLICPCSERLEIGIIVSAVCMSILDLYSTIVSHFTDRPHAPGQHFQSPLSSILAVDDDGGSGLFWNDLPFFASRNSNSQALHRGRKEDVMLVHVLGELSKLAAVVCQFTKRYRTGQGQPASSEILEDVAAFLKSRLKAIGGGTAAKLQTDPITARAVP